MWFRVRLIFIIFTDDTKLVILYQLTFCKSNINCRRSEKLRAAASHATVEFLYVVNE